MELISLGYEFHILYSYILLYVPHFAVGCTFKLPSAVPSFCVQENEAIHAKQLFSQQEHILARIMPFFIITNLVRFCYYFIHFRAYNFIYSVLANHYYKEVCHLLHIVKLKVVIIEQMG